MARTQRVSLQKLANSKRKKEMEFEDQCVLPGSLSIKVRHAHLHDRTARLRLGWLLSRLIFIVGG